MTRLQMHDLFIGILLILAGLLIMFILIPNGISAPNDLDILALSPRFWPRIITGCLIFCGVIITLQGFIEVKNRDPADADQKPFDFNGLFSMEMGRAALTIGFLLIYYWSINHIGIVAASLLAIILFTFYGGEKRIGYILSIAIILPIALYYFFTLVANVPLPLGFFEQWR